MSDNTLSMTEALDLIRATAPTDEPTQDAAPAETPVEPPSDVEPAALDDDAPVETAAQDVEEPEQAEEVEAEATAEPDTVELPERLIQAEDGTWQMRVVVDGEERTLAIDDIVENVQKREATENRFKEAQARAKEARDLQNQMTAELQTYQQTLMQMQQELQAVQAASQLTPEQEAQLSETDPKALLQIKRLQEAREQKLAEIHQQQADAFQQQVQHQAQRAMELMPEWSDPETLNRERQGIVDTALAAGFTAEEINQLNDARMLPVFRAAWQYQQMQQGATDTKQKRTAPRVVKRKAPVAAEPAKSKRQREAMQKLSKTGKFNDGLDVLVARRG